MATAVNDEAAGEVVDRLRVAIRQDHVGQDTNFETALSLPPASGRTVELSQDLVSAMAILTQCAGMRLLIA